MNIECTSSRRNTAKQKPITPKPSESEITSFYTEISKAEKPALLSIVPNFPKKCERCSSISVDRYGMFDQQMLEANYMDLLMKCEEAFNNLAVIGEQAQKATRGQSLSKLWFQHRAGRIIASMLKSAVHTDITQTSQSLI